MDYGPTDFTSIPNSIFESLPMQDFDSDSLGFPCAQDETDDASRNLGLSSNWRDDNISSEPVGFTGPGLLHLQNPWTAQCSLSTLSTEEVVGSHGTFGQELEIIDSGLGVAGFDSAWGMENSEASLALTTLNHGQNFDRFDNVLNTEIPSNSGEMVSIGVFNEELDILNLGHHQGNGNNGSSLGLESFGDRLGNTISHEIQDLDIFDPSLNMATVDLSFAFPGLDGSRRIASFDDVYDDLNHLNPNLHSMTFMPLSAPGAAGDGALCLSHEGPLGGELLHSTAERIFAGVPHATECQYTVHEAGLTMDSVQFDMPLSPDWLTQGIACDIALNEQSKSIAKRQPNNTAYLNTNFGVDVNLISCLADAGQADVKSKSKIAPKRNRHSDSEWREADKHIRRLYLEKGHTAEEVEFEMAVIHDFEASVSKYKKRVAGWGKDIRLRTAKAFPRTKSAESHKIFEITSEQVRRAMVEERCRERSKHEEENERRRQLQIEIGNEKGGKRGRNGRHVVRKITKANIGPFLGTVYIHQEELFHAIGTLFNNMFAAERKSWTVDTRRFKPPANSPDFAEAWQLLSDQVASIHMLVEGQLYRHAKFMLGQVLAGLRVTARVCDPSFMVHFWTICHVLLGVPVRSRGKFQASPWLGWFLRHLKQIFSSAFGRHPLVVIVDSLLKVWASSPRDLKATIGLGYWKAIHTLGSLIGSEHNIVLNMGARCTKMWKSKFSASSLLVEFLHQPLLTGTIDGLGPEQIAEVSLDYLFAASKEKYNDLSVVYEANQLLSWTREICREKADPEIHLETWKQPKQKENKQPNRELSYKHMVEAIEVLRYGDLQCRIRATSFSKRLSVWIKGHRRKTGDRPTSVAIEEEKRRVFQEKIRTRELVRRINKEPIKGSRRKRLVRGKLEKIPRYGLAVERDLLLASLLV